MTADAATVGARVLAALDHGRRVQLERRQARAAAIADIVLRAARLDRAAGKPDRGRAGRVARRLHLSGVTISERRVAQIIGNVGQSFPHHSAKS